MGNHRATRSDRRRHPVVRSTSGGSRVAQRTGRPERTERSASRTERPNTRTATRTATRTVTRTVVPAPREERRSPSAGGGRRRAAKPASPLVRVLPSAPILVGVTALAISTGGAVAAADPELVGRVTESTAGAAAASSLGTQAKAGGIRGRDAIVSRDSRRQARARAEGAELLQEAEQQAEQRSETLQVLTRKAAVQSKRIEENQWVLPLGHYSITARFGQYGLWASYHTGLDFNGNTGDPIMAVANGTISEVGYDGAYGNKTVLTLEDGTEIWFCHQTSMYVSPGETVRAGDVIGTVGATGNVTGSHLHLEVRPGGGDPVDPAAAFAAQGIAP